MSGSRPWKRPGSPSSRYRRRSVLFLLAGYLLPFLPAGSRRATATQTGRIDFGDTPSRPARTWPLRRASKPPQPGTRQGPPASNLRSFQRILVWLWNEGDRHRAERKRFSPFLYAGSMISCPNAFSKSGTVMWLNLTYWMVAPFFWIRARGQFAEALAAVFLTADDLLVIA